MLSGRYLILFAIILSGMNAVPAYADIIQVKIDKMVFSPAEFEAKIGDTIEWINNDILAHTATVRGEWDVVIEPKRSARLVLKTAGAVEYYCRFHPNMRGRIGITSVTRPD